MRSFLLLSVLLVACGSSGDEGGGLGGAASQTDVDDVCAANCAAQKKCVSTVDETTCVNSCKNDLAAIGTKLRADYMSSVETCYRTASCDKLRDCDDTAEASISPSPAVQTFCDELMKKHADCGVSGQEKSKCLENTKPFADPAVESARACLTKACSDYARCVLTTLGLD